jgi:Arc/MetJ-type ribon-helix-helix transcriptional regulator
MTIHLPPDIESSIQAAVDGGHFASVDAAMTEAASMLLERLKPEQTPPKPGMGSIGAMRDDAELLGQVTQLIMQGRRTRTLRLPPDE